MRKRLGLPLPMIVALAIVACADESPRDGTDQSAIDAELERALAAAEPTKASPGGSAELGEDAVVIDPDWRVEVTGYGPVRIGMSVDEVVEALGGAVAVPEELGGCDYLFPRGWPEGISVMVVEGRVARIDVSRGQVKTAEGVGIGTTEQEILELYPGQVEVLPHKYTEGNYLIVSPAGPLEAEYRIVFETDGAVVERYRVGVLPAVEWVEGCA